MTTRSAIRVDSGLTTLDQEAVEILDLLDQRFVSWATAALAKRMRFPPLLQVADLQRLDYFQNFPHLGVLATTIKPTSQMNFAAGAGAQAAAIPSEELTDATWALPSAACYNVYLYLADSQLETPAHVTTVAQCFRNEERFDGLKRLLSFTMREIVCVGSVEAAQEHLRLYKQRVLDFALSLGLTLDVRVATDPFFDLRSSRALSQQLFPVKEEFVYGESTAIASANFHRNFFGERCNIRQSQDGSYAFSSCVAFGLERWLFALLDRHDHNLVAIRELLQ